MTFSAQTVIIIIIMSIAVLSAVTGIDKGVKLLSEINISVALVLMLLYSVQVLHYPY